VLIDFKQDWSLPLTLSQEQQDFFGPRQVAHLGVVVITPLSEDSVHTEYYHFLQRPSKKDSVMVAECLLDLSVLPLVRDCKTLQFFADCGSHFHNTCVLYHLLSPASPFAGRTLSITFFAEHHGKSDCDSAFGYLTQKVLHGLNDGSIKCLFQFLKYLAWLQKPRLQGGAAQISSNHHFLRYVVHMGMGVDMTL
jgi:hypothetical protein